MAAVEDPSSANEAPAREETVPAEEGIRITRHEATSVEARLQEASQQPSIRHAEGVLRSLLLAQAEQARREGRSADEPCDGDAATRRGLQSLLPDESVRLLFLDFVANATNMPRVVHVFGPPPFHFLKKEDCSLLNAAGFRASRSHMVYEEAVVCNYSQFGAAHYHDSLDRQYKVLFSKDKIYDAASPLPQNSVAWHSGSQLDMAVRIPIRKRGDSTQLFFPAVGDEIELFIASSRRLGRRAGQQTPAFVAKARLKALRLRDRGAKTALARCVLVSKPG